ncbi:MAG: hypothetical protein WC717_06160 [Candidatus Micrarchaeia archaeon]|jgi:hypothetical protein
MRYHIFAIFASTLLLLFGCTQPSGPIVTPEPPAIPAPAPANNTSAAAAPCTGGNIVQNDDCFLSLASEKSDSGYCRSIYSIDKLDACLAVFANSSLDICKQVTGAEMRFSCLTANAVREKSEAICNMIDNTEASAACLRQVLPPCMLVSGESERSLCIALDKGDFSYCQDDACLEAYALNTSEGLACGAISQQNERYYCLALVAKSASACLDAPLTPVQDSCIERAARALGDMSSCSLAGAGSPYRNSCYLYFAVAQGDASVCQRSSSETDRDSCYWNYSVSTATVDACPRIIESTNRVDCYFKSAKLNRKPSLCNMLWTSDFKNTCYAGAILYPDAGPVPSDCPDVESTDWRDKCYYQAARITYNGTLCGLMTNSSSDKRNCESLFN